MSDAIGRNSAVDPLRLILAAFVIALHMRFPAEVGGLIRGMLVQGVYRIAVPSFAVISGYFFFNTMAQKRASHYIKRILFLYGLWTLIYLPVWRSEVKDLKDMIKTVFFGYYHLWFLSGLAIAAWILLKVKQFNISNFGIFALAAVCVAVGIVVQYVAMMYREIPIEIYRNALFSIFPYFAIGWLIASKKEKFTLHRVPKVIRIAAVGICLGIPAIEAAFWLRISDGIGVDNMVCLPIVVPAIFLISLGTTGRWPGKKMAEVATFVYLIHIIVIKASPYVFDAVNMQTLFVMVVSFGLAWGLSSLSSGRRMLEALT